MDKIINTKSAAEITKELKRQHKKLVLTGGVFDILHVGHTRFLKQARKKGDYLFVLLESDSRVKKLKGEMRPINNQKFRAEILASLYFVDYVVILSKSFSNKDYDKLINVLKPDLIALTKNSPTKIYAKRQAEKIGAEVLEIIPRIINQSTTKIAEIISRNF